MTETSPTTPPIESPSEANHSAQGRIWVTWLPVGIACILLLLLMASDLKASLALNDGRLVYALDDPYIHMAMAKNLVRHGIWGVDATGFSGASSSPVYVLMLALAFALVGVQDVVPLVLNVLAALGLVVLLAKGLESYRYRPPTAAILALLIAILMPIEVLVFSGMEHVLQALADVAFVLLAVDLISARVQPSRGALAAVCLLAALATGLRYEGAAMVAVVSLLLMARRRWLPALVVAVSGAIPPIAYGLVSIANGAFFLPTSIVLRLRPGILGQTLRVLQANVTGAPTVVVPSPYRSTIDLILDGQNRHLLILLTLAVVLLLIVLMQGRTLWRRDAVLLSVVVATSLAHVAQGNFGWFYRYEAYLVALLYFAIFAGLRGQLMTLAESASRSSASRLSRIGSTVLIAALAGAVAVALVPSLQRTNEARSRVVPAMNIVYSQQYQMAQFLKKYYPGATVVANDIGAINFYADIKCLDIWGLGNADIAALKKKKGVIFFGEDAVSELRKVVEKRRPQIAIVFDARVPAGLRADWNRTAEWTVGSGILVEFYSVNPESRGYLESSLAEYADSLPPKTKQQLF